MTECHKPQAIVAGQPQAKAYRAPELQIYGAMARLTAGGTGPVNEAMVGGMSMNKNKL